MKSKCLTACRNCGGLEGWESTLQGNFVTEVFVCHECGNEWFRYWRGEAHQLGGLEKQPATCGPVSYTHLTLPTKA